MSPGRMRFAAVAVAAGLAGCQWVTGDFEIAPAARGEPCYPGEIRCDTGKLLSCGAERFFEVIEDCGSPATCDASAQACRTCSQGERMCNGAELFECGASGWQLLEKCETPELCVFRGDRSSAQCEAAFCADREYQCSGNALLRCSKSRDHFELLELCASADLCDAAAANDAAATGGAVHCIPSCEGDCPRECQPGTKRCGAPGLILEHCNADGRWADFATCASSELCNAAEGRCMPAPCSELELRCRGQSLERCSPALTHFELVRECPADQACDVTVGNCVPRPTCEEGGFRCAAATLERCEDGVWEPHQVCETPALCNADAGFCDPPQCYPGLYECQGSQLNSCEKTDHVWVQTRVRCDEETQCTPYFDTSAIDNACVPL